MRQAIPHPRNETAACACCGKVGGALWENCVKVLDFGNGLVLEPDTTAPTRCDDCEQAELMRDPEYRRLMGR